MHQQNWSFFECIDLEKLLLDSCYPLKETSYISEWGGQLQRLFRYFILIWCSSYYLHESRAIRTLEIKLFEKYPDCLLLTFQVMHVISFFHLRPEDLFTRSRARSLDCGAIGVNTFNSCTWEALFSLHFSGKYVQRDILRIQSFLCNLII